MHAHFILRITKDMAVLRKKAIEKKPWLIKVADRVQTRSTKYQQQYWGCAKQLKKKRFIFF
jgi:hypothetical protein